MKTEIFKERKKNIADLILNNELYVPMKTKEIAILLTHVVPSVYKIKLRTTYYRHIFCQKQDYFRKKESFCHYGPKLPGIIS